MCVFTRDVDVVLILKDALADGQFELQLRGGKTREVHVQIAHEMRKLPILEEEDRVNVCK